jgi:membrane-bound lytic murein transglycosylase B
LRLALACAAIFTLRAPPCRAAERAFHGDERGWTYIMNKLVTDGVDHDRVEEVFTDSRFGSFTGLMFELHPREPRSMYRGFLRSSSIARARVCRANYREELDAAERRFGVPANVLTAILHVETGCGGNTGRSLILPRLARLAMANDPENVERNLERQTPDDTSAVDPATARSVRARASYLEATFYPEVLATFTLAERLQVDPLDIHGSSSGAFGIPQFLPRSYLRYGVDGNGNGRVSLFEPADAIASCANYLVHNGWKPGLSLNDRRHVLWSYNHSPAYIDTVLALATRLDTGGTTRSQEAAKKKPSRSTRSHAPVHSAKNPPHDAKARAVAQN